MKRVQYLLQRTNKQFTADKAQRIANSVDNAFQRKMLDMESQLASLEDKKERLLDMSASNNTTTRNAIEDLESDGFVDEVIRLDYDIAILTEKMVLAKETRESLLGEVDEDGKVVKATKKSK